MRASVIPFPAPTWRNRSPLFEVCTTRPDGTTQTDLRRGGSSVDHTLEAMEAAGLGAVVRVRRVDQAVSA
ncbi:hypothetical protein [Aquincola sp. J276]|uniref:hypothetical protein n=1 Tax=Aquincola sp. J276 TaxID=2898432 RepID=UPI0021519088|nr:hypothetical protein [Aquincola sp. J276]MCR5864672.1 hypothetical protein [Aquincola sp. J276]